MPLTFVSVALVLTAAVVLTVSLIGTGSIYRQTREDSKSWVHPLLLMAVLIPSYFAYAALIATRPASLYDLLASLVLLGSSAMVWVANNLSHSVMDKLTRITALERHRANHDYLTSLPKGSFFIAHLDNAIRNRDPSQLGEAAMLMMDLNRFKLINDKMGHYYGDLLLKEIALRLHRSIRKTDMLARLGGDEFGVWIDPVTEPEHVQQVAQHIVAALEEPFAVEGRAADVGVSIGIAWYPKHGTTSAMLMKHAKAALLQAKRAHLDTVVYTETLDTSGLDQLVILSELRKAIDHNELMIHYQPIIDIKSGKITSVEALVRWPHSNLGLLSPDEFIPLAEQDGLIHRFSYWVLDIVLDQLVEWQRIGQRLRICTNVSAINLQDENFHAYVVDGMTSREISPEQLKLEITESTLMSNSEQALTAIRQLVAFGVTFAIDDFGTGYSTLEYLKNLPVNEIKIDKSFVLHLDKDSNDAVIIRSTIDLAHKMGCYVTAEGVDSPETLELLKKWHCDRAQGFYLSQPLSIAELTRILHQGATKSSFNQVVE